MLENCSYVIIRPNVNYRWKRSSRRYHFHMTRGRAMPTRRMTTTWVGIRSVNLSVDFSRARIRSSLDAAGNARRRRDAAPRRVTAKSRPSTLVGAESRGRANAVRTRFIFFLFSFLSIAPLYRSRAASVSRDDCVLINRARLRGLIMSAVLFLPSERCSLNRSFDLVEIQVSSPRTKAGTHGASQIFSSCFPLVLSHGTVPDYRLLRELRASCREMLLPILRGH